MLHLVDCYGDMLNVFDVHILCASNPQVGRITLPTWGYSSNNVSDVFSDLPVDKRDGSFCLVLRKKFFLCVANVTDVASNGCNHVKQIH